MTTSDIRTGLIEEAELAACKTLCVVITSDIDGTREILSITGPFDGALEAVAYGEETCKALAEHTDDVNYQLRALWAPE